MRRSLAALALAFLGLIGPRPDALPFIPGAAYSDAAISHWPGALHFQGALRGGDFPIWQHALMGGGPFAANPLYKTAYPPQWLALLFPPTLHLNLLIVGHLLLAGWGMGRWALMLGLSREAALLSAVGYALAPRLLAHLGAGHLDLIYALAWWPWLMAAAGRWGSGGGAIQHGLWAGFFAALLFLADVRLSLFALSFAGLWGIWSALRCRAGRSLARLIPVAGLVFLLLTLPVTLPLLSWGPHLNRGGLSAVEAGVFSLEPAHLITLALPARGANHELLAYVGLPLLLLALIGLGDAPRLWLAVGLLAALYSLGGNGFLWPILVDLVPPLLWFRVPGRAWLVIALLAPLTAGFGLDRLRRLWAAGGASVRWGRLLAVGVMALSGLCGGMALLALVELDPLIGLGVLLTGIATGLILLLAFYERLRPQIAAHLLIAVVCFDLLWVGTGWLEWRPETAWRTHQAGVVAALHADDAARLYSPDYALEQQIIFAEGLRLFGGVDPFQLRGVAVAVTVASGIDSGSYSVVLPPLPEGDASPPDAAILAAWDVSHVLATTPLTHPQLTLHAEIEGVFIYRNAAYAPGSAAIDPQTGWPVAWPGLPSPAEVARLNRLNLTAAGVGAACFILCLLLLWRLRPHA